MNVQKMRHQLARHSRPRPHVIRIPPAPEPRHLGCFACPKSLTLAGTPEQEEEWMWLHWQLDHPHLLPL